MQNASTNALENAEVDVTTFNARINNSFTATKDLRFQLFGMYRGKTEDYNMTENQCIKWILEQPTTF